MYDLRTGEPVYGRGGEGPNCPAFTGYGCGDDQIEAVVVGADAVSAVLANFFQDPFSPGCPNSNGCLVQEIIASDASGVRVLDTARYTSAIGPLSHLSLDRDTLSWTHSAQPKSEQLHP